MATFDPATKTFVVVAADPFFFTLPESIPGANVIGDERDNFLYGNSSINRIEGGTGDDHLDGGAGADTLIGGLGRDFYTVDNSLDVVVEDWNSGEKDYVSAFVSYVLGANIEELRLQDGAGNINGTGNNLNNDLIGNDGDNRLEGLDGGDFLDGRLGADVMIGGLGNDRYAVDNPGDQVIETAEAGGRNDTVYTTIDYTLPSEVESLMADTVRSLRLTGNELNNAISSSDGNDILQGVAGKDTISGGFGSDTLQGGIGKDVFVFDSKLGTYKTDREVNFDTIKDFNVKDDALWLDNKVFTKLGKKGTVAMPATLTKSFFTVGNKAKDKDDYLVYDKKKGVLYYDADGSGKGKAVEIAKLNKNLKMTYKDVFII